MFGGALIGRGERSNAGNPEMITNGTFDTDTSSWVKLNSSTQVVSQQCEVTVEGPSGGIYQSIPTVTGVTYIASFDYTEGTLPIGINIKVGGTENQSVRSTGHYELEIIATADDKEFQTIRATGDVGNYLIDNISVKEK